jgi:hypothetical protein
MEDQHINYWFKHIPIIVYGFIKRNGFAIHQYQSWMQTPNSNDQRS